MITFVGIVDWEYEVKSMQILGYDVCRAPMLGCLTYKCLFPCTKCAFKVVGWVKIFAVVVWFV